MEFLTVYDYINRPLAELVGHPDFDLNTFEAIAKVITVQPSCRDNFVQLISALIDNRQNQTIVN